MTDGTLIWSGTGVELVLALGADSPVSLVSVHPRGTGARRGDASARSRVPASGSGEAPSGAGAAGPAPSSRCSHWATGGSRAAIGTPTRPSARGCGPASTRAPAGTVSRSCGWWSISPCRTCANPASGSPPTRCVGESEVISPG